MKKKSRHRTWGAPGFRPKWSVRNTPPHLVAAGAGLGVRVGVGGRVEGRVGVRRGRRSRASCSEVLLPNVSTALAWAASNSSTHSADAATAAACSAVAPCERQGSHV